MSGQVIPKDFDWQGHRGARGLAPENTIAGMIKALEYPIKTLELDVVISRDHQVILSHEPWMNPDICTDPDGKTIPDGRSVNLYQLTHEEISKYDCGSRVHPGFPGQVPYAASKPSLPELTTRLKAFIGPESDLPNLNIEIKSNPQWDGVYTPPVELFADLVMKAIVDHWPIDRVCIQSFDPRALRHIHQANAEIRLAFLTPAPSGLEEQIESLGFVPDIYSPNHSRLTAEIVDLAHEQGMLVVPWTVNEVKRMKQLIAMGVDGIITDYPNLIEQATH
jgi:glycerophosphoryl diester phosphodiesterase